MTLSAPGLLFSFVKKVPMTGLIRRMSNISAVIRTPGMRTTESFSPTRLKKNCHNPRLS
jgi:hypothetical protein